MADRARNALPTRFPLAVGGSRNSGAAFGGIMCCGILVASKMAVYSAWLAVVCRSANPGERSHSDSGAGSGRPLHVFAVDWAIHFGHVGRVRCGCARVDSENRLR